MKPLLDVIDHHVKRMAEVCKVSEAARGPVESEKYGVREHLIMAAAHAFADPADEERWRNACEFFWAHAEQQ